ncbi:PREDICTED: uncharacterized protein LOC105312711 [Amphimedon queenslandica]|uniref:MADF domain-containing protein n=1 Tax=Amphimedon queenslandica TaxID=400682 RepID=A0A1X7UWL7_AMPQE|nr:PREDICTED: uncharacterized protein LOC105312711 [Amphimedon queenslandica]|eukprot:XP_011403873.1 PREDICTED: uncharacterized protein LOC105312711 [Amphimedon queenslandica]
MAELDEKLISSVEQYPCLYNTKCMDFRIRTKKENAWKAIADHLPLLRRWKTLRERYTKELKKRKILTGTGADEVIKEWDTVGNMVDMSDLSTVEESSTLSSPPQVGSIGSLKADDDMDTDENCLRSTL